MFSKSDLLKKKTKQKILKNFNSVFGFCRLSPLKRRFEGFVRLNCLLM